MGAQFLIEGAGLNTEVAALSIEGYVTAWRGADKAIHVQRLASNGDPIGGPIVVEGFGGTPTDPQVVALSGGGFVVTWSEAIDLNSYMIYSCWFDQTGNVTASGPISDTAMFSPFHAKTAPFGDGYVVTWDEFETEGNDFWSEVKVMAFNGDGSIGVSEFTVSATTGDQLSPVVASLASPEPTIAVA